MNQVKLIYLTPASSIYDLLISLIVREAQLHGLQYWRKRVRKKIQPQVPSSHSVCFKALDDLDRLILQYLQQDGRMTSLELSRLVDLSPAGLQKRLKKLEKTGVIDGYVTRINREALGLDLLCFMQVTLAHDKPTCIGEFCDRVQDLPEILECHHLTGEFDYLLKIVVVNNQDLERFLQEQIIHLPGVERIKN